MASGFYNQIDPGFEVDETAVPDPAVQSEARKEEESARQHGVFRSRSQIASPRFFSQHNSPRNNPAETPPLRSTAPSGSFAILEPRKQRSVLLNESARYHPMADDGHVPSNLSFCPLALAADNSAASPRLKNRSLSHQPTRDYTETFQFMLPGADETDETSSSSSSSTLLDELGGKTKTLSDYSPHAPFGVQSGHHSRSRSSSSEGEHSGTAAISSAGSHTVAKQGNTPVIDVPLLHSSHDNELTAKDHVPDKVNNNASLYPLPHVGGSGGGGRLPKGKPFMGYIDDNDEYFSLPMPHHRPCVSSENLEDDSMSYTSFWQSLKSEAVLKGLLTGFRITLFSVMPSFVLIHHPNTSSYFVSGALIPIFAGMFVRDSLGAQCVMTIMALYSIIVTLVWGVLMNALSAANHTSAWWCAVIFGSFSLSMLGDLPAKRMMMVMLIIVMQMEHLPGGMSLIFPCKFTRDMLISTAFGTLGNILPFPTLCTRQSAELMAALHKLYAVSIGGAMKSFWAPVILDGKFTLEQTPLTKIHELTGKMKMLIFLISYEPTEFNLNNILRGERVAFLASIKVHLYAMLAAASQRLEEAPTYRSRVSKELRGMKQRLQQPAMDLAVEVIAVLTAVGEHISPEGIINHVNFDKLADRATVLDDIIERERMDMLIRKPLPCQETNFILRFFAFHSSLLDIATEILKLETKMKNFDPTKYPSLWQRALNFFFLARWNEFWEALPSRLTLATPRDVRLAKDAIKYALAFAVACAFTLNYDQDNVYYFGMAILARLAQQTASETLQVGINRICGLVIGASLAYITVNNTHNLAEETLLTMTFVFVALCFSQHPVYFNAALYVFIICITGLSLAPRPALLLTRITDNVFAFITFFAICVLMFPCDPIRVLWNTRSKLLISLNSVAQSLVVLGCSPITMDGVESAPLIAAAQKLVGRQQLLLKEYSDWMGKCATEPTVRGGVYPHAACVQLLIVITQTASLQDTILHAMTRLHRAREAGSNAIVRDLLQLTRPFLLDISKIIHRYFQGLIDATEHPLQWTCEDVVRTVWRGQLACRSLRHITGRIQHNFFAALQEVASHEKSDMNKYLNASFVEQKVLGEDDPVNYMSTASDELVQRLLAMSVHVSKDNLLSRDDLQAFNAVIVVFETMLNTMAQFLKPMTEIHAFEKSRVA